LIIGDRDDHADVFEEDYRLSPNTNKKVTIKFRSPSFAGKFPVYYSFYEKGSGTGQIKIVQETQGKFYISVDNSTVIFEGLGFPYEEDDTKIIFYTKDLYEVDDLIFLHDDVKVEFKELVDLDDFEWKFVKFEHNKVRIDSANLENFKDKRAKITFYNLNYTREPDVLKDGKICVDCEILEYDSDEGKLVFQVEGFSQYTTRPDSSEPVSTTTSSPSSGGSDSSGDAGNTGNVELSLNDDTVGKTPKEIMAESMGEDEFGEPNSLLKTAPDAFETEGEEMNVRGVKIIDNKKAAKSLFMALSWIFMSMIFASGLVLLSIREFPQEISMYLEAIRK
jgi:hypothetical protein